MLVEVMKDGKRADAEALACLADIILSAGDELCVRSQWMAANIATSIVLNVAAMVPVGAVVAIEDAIAAYPDAGPLQDAAVELVKWFEVKRVG